MTTHTIERTIPASRRVRQAQIVTRWLIPLALVALALPLYLTTLSDVHTFDALSYIRDVDQRAGFFFHPHHLLYSPTGWLFWQGWRLFGYGGGSELALKVLNSLVGAACGFGLYRMVLRLTDRWWAALLAAGLLLFNYGAWYFSVEVEVYLLALVWVLIALALLIELITTPRARTAPLLGLSVGLAALYHQTNGLLVPLVVAGVLLSPTTWRDRLRNLLTAGVISGAVVAIGYALVGFGYNGYRSIGQMRDWMFFFVETGWWGHATRDRLTDLGAGLGNSISTQGAWPYWVAIVAVLLAGMVGAARRWPRIVALCALWIAVYGGFFAWWEGDNIEFWIATLLPLWLLVGLCAAAIPLGRSRPTIQRGQSVLAIGAIVLPLLLSWHNYPIVTRRGDAAQDLQRQISTEVGRLSSPDDMIISTGGVLELYLPYYEDRHYIRTFNMVLFETNGDLQSGFAELHREIDQALHAGLAVFVGQDSVELPEFARQRYNLTQADLDAFWASYRPLFQDAVVHNGTTYFWRIPPATELANGDGWRWTSGSIGWQSANADSATFDGGWCFTPQVDPALVGPQIGVDSARFRAVEVTMRTAAQNQQAQLFFAGADGAMSDDRSVIWPLDNDGQTHTYTVPLSADRGWSGSIARLRLDPIAIGDGTDATRTCVESLKLIP